MLVWTIGKLKNSALHLAYANNSMEMVRLLTDYGADHQYKNKLGQIPSELSTMPAKTVVSDKPCFQVEKINEIPTTQAKKESEMMVLTQPSTRNDIYTPSLRGRTGENYKAFIDYISKNEIKVDNMHTLGAWDKNNQAYYFEQSKKSIQYARHFLNAYWSESSNVQLTIENHNQKVLEKKKYNSKVEFLFPSCVSFITATVSGREYCFIASSSIDDSEIGTSLKKLVEEINQKGNSIESVLLGGKISYFNEVLRVLIGNEYVTKGCSEKYYVKYLTKLWLEFGSDFQVSGISNCSFYPYNLNKSYGDRAQDLVDRTVRPFTRGSDKLILNDKTYVSLIPCCPFCKKNKITVAKILKGSQEYKINHDNKMEENKEIRRKLELSPIRNSIKSNSSLLAKFTSFQNDMLDVNVQATDIYNSDNWQNINKFV